MNTAPCEMVSFAAFSFVLQGATPPLGSVATPSIEAQTTIWSVPVVAAPAMNRAETKPTRIAQDRRGRGVDAQLTERRRRRNAETHRRIRNRDADRGRRGRRLPGRRAAKSWFPRPPAFGPTTDGLAWTVRSLITTPAGSGFGNAVLPALTGTTAVALAPVPVTVASAVTPVRFTLARPAASVVATAEDKVPPVVTKLTTMPPRGTLAASTTEAEISTGVVAIQCGRRRCGQVTVVPVTDTPAAPVTVPLVATDRDGPVAAIRTESETSRSLRPCGSVVVDVPRRCRTSRST